MALAQAQQHDEELAEAMALCRNSTKVTAKTLFPGTFSLPFSKEHDKIFELIDDESETKVALGAPRAYGKSSIMQKAFIGRKVLFQDSVFNITVSASNTSAVMFTENLKREIVSNKYIKGLFGNLESGKWAKDMWVTADNMAVFPRGAGQQVRGINFGDYRPNTIVVDDLETSEGVMNEDTRAKLKDWFFTDLMQSVDRVHGWRIIVIGTLLHEASLLKELIDDSGWASVPPNETGERVISIANPNNMKSNWPELQSDEAIQEEMDAYRKQGILDQWYMEKMNMIVPAGERSFPKSCFKYYQEDEMHFDNLDHLETAVILDPAKTVDPKSADSGIVVVTFDRVANRIYVRDCVGEKYMPNEALDRALDFCQDYKASVLGCEVTSLENWISYPIENELYRRNLGIEYVALKAKGDKEGRVAGLIPLYRRGLVWHNTTTCGRLEAQLLSFPRSKRWDIMDALAYAPTLFYESGRIMDNVEEHTDERGYLDPDPVDELGKSDWCIV